MASLSDQIRDHPMFFAQLNRLHRQREQFTPPKTTPNQHREHRSVALAAESVGAGALQQPLALLSGQPIFDSYPEPTNSLHTAYARQFWTQQTGISCLVGNSANCCETQVDREGAYCFCSRLILYRSTTVRLKARRGSEQYHSTNSLMA